MLLVRHDPVSALGMNAMELMAVSASPALLDPVGPKPGDRVKLAVRQRDDQLILIRIEKLP
jgi:Cu/Ag efflux protein CusF